MHHATRIVPGLLLVAVAAGCNSDGGNALPSTPPTKVELLADSGFRDVGAVASSPDGQTFYAAASDEEDAPGIFSVTVDSGAVASLHVGTPLLYPSDLDVSCDGTTLFVTDMGHADGEAIESEFDDVEDEDASVDIGGLYTVASDGSSISKLEVTGISRAAGVVVSVDCDTLYVTGWTDALQPAVFTVPVAGGAATVIHEGAPLVSPTGVHVDADNVAWVMDHEARNESGQGMLFAITPEGEVSEVISDLEMGRHGGVSLVPGGTTAVIPTRNEDGDGQLVTASTKTGDVVILEAPHISEPTGVAAARNAPVMVVAGEQSISIATFDSE